MGRGNDGNEITKEGGMREVRYGDGEPDECGLGAGIGREFHLSIYNYT